MSEDEVSALLGRSLTAIETENFDLYLNIATERLSQLLCFDLTVVAESGEPVATDMIYMPRIGYKSLYTQPFTAIDSVAVGTDMQETTDYTLKQYEKFNGSWYNTIVFDDKMADELVTVTAVWGMDSLPQDLQVLLAKMFGLHGREVTDNSVKAKSIEGFSVTYRDNVTSYSDFLESNAALINRYRRCDEGEVQHGATYFGTYYDRI